MSSRPQRRLSLLLFLESCTYPQNVVLLLGAGGLDQAETAGKAFESKFVVWGGMQQGGLKGRF